MKKEAIITIIIIILILAGEWITQNYTNKKLSELQEDLSSLKEEILAESDVDSLIQKTEEIYNNWEKENEILSYYLEHNELEKVNTQIILIKGYLESDAPQDSIPDLEEGIYILEHIKEKEAFNLKNILPFQLSVQY